MRRDRYASLRETIAESFPNSMVFKPGGVFLRGLKPDVMLRLSVLFNDNFIIAPIIVPKIGSLTHVTSRNLCFLSGMLGWLRSNKYVDFRIEPPRIIDIFINAREDVDIMEIYYNMSMWELARMGHYGRYDRTIGIHARQSDRAFERDTNVIFLQKMMEAL